MKMREMLLKEENRQEDEIALIKMVMKD